MKKREDEGGNQREGGERKVKNQKEEKNKRGRGKKSGRWNNKKGNNKSEGEKQGREEEVKDKNIKDEICYKKGERGGEIREEGENVRGVKINEIVRKKMREKCEFVNNNCTKP